MNTTLIAALIGIAALFPLGAQAQLHEGDIELSVVNSTIVLSGNDIWHADGSAIFEGNFGDLAGGPYKTDDPGYDSEPGTFAAGTFINYKALGRLQFWNGAMWATTVPTNEFVRLDGNLGESTQWISGGTAGDLTGLIGQASQGGNVHEHLDLSVARVGGGVPAVGAYLIQLQITSDAYSSSAPFYLALNRGLTGEGFEAAVGALAPVPEPQTWLLMAAGLVAVGSRIRRAV